MQQQRNILPLGNTQSDEFDSVDTGRSLMSNLSDSDLATIIQSLSSLGISPRFWGDVSIVASELNDPSLVIRWLHNHSECSIHISKLSAGTIKSVHCCEQNKSCPHQLELGANAIHLIQKQKEYFIRLDTYRASKLDSFESGGFPVLYTPPAPRLVGIEPNPGPGPATVIAASQIGSAMMDLLKGKSGKKVKIATTKKKKPSIKKRSTSSRSSTMMSMGQSETRVSVPAHVGIRSYSQNSVGSFHVPFNVVLLQIQTNATSPFSPYFGVVGNGPLVAGAAGVSLSPFITSGPTTVPTCFPLMMQRLAASFARYRVKPGSLRLSFRGAQGSSIPGIVAISAGPPDYPLGTTIAFQTVAGSECAITTPVWVADCPMDPKRLNDVIDSGDDWRYTDFDGTVTQPEIRQDAFLNLYVAGFGTVSSTIYGYIVCSGVFEFKHLQDDLSLTALKKNRPPIIISSSSISGELVSSSSTCPLSPPVLHRCEDHVSDSVMVCTVCKH
jgi:hypothetical protein